MQRHSVRWDTSDQNLVDGFFKHVQTSHAQNAIDVTGDNNLQNNRRPFGHEHLVAQLFGSHFIVGNRTGATTFAVEPKLSVLGRAALSVLQTVRQQQHAAIEGDREKLLLPEEVADHHHREPEKLFGQSQLIQQSSSVVFQFVASERTAAIQIASVLFGSRFDFFAKIKRLRHCLQVSRTASLALFSRWCRIVVVINETMILRKGGTHRFVIVSNLVVDRGDRHR